MLKWFQCIIFIVALLYSTLPYCSKLPELGSEHEQTLSIQTEQIMGEVIMQQLRTSGLLTSDPLLTEYITQLGKRLLHAVPRHPFKIKFYTINDFNLNAFAFFGGNIVVHTGLIAGVESESELAAVLSHELAHVLQKHLGRLLAHNKKLMPLTIAELVAAIVIGMGSPEIGSHAIPGILAGHQQQLINFTRENEHEADRIGMQILANAHFDPFAMANVFYHLSHAARFTEKPIEYLMTHPLYESRIADARNRAEQLHYRQSLDSIDFQLIRYRLAVFKNPNPKQLALQYEREIKIKKTANQDATQYGYALALFKNRKTKEALTIMATLNDKYPNNLIIQLSYSQMEFAGQQKAQSLARLKKLLAIYPGNLSVVLQYAAQLLEVGEVVPAFKLLKQYEAELKDNIDFLELLAKAYSVNKQFAKMHTTLANKYVLLGDFKRALHQLDIAIEQTKNADSIQQLKKEQIIIKETEMKQKQVL